MRRVPAAAMRSMRASATRHADEDIFTADAVCWLAAATITAMLPCLHAYATLFFRRTPLLRFYIVDFRQRAARLMPLMPMSFRAITLRRSRLRCPYALCCHGMFVAAAAY